MSSFTVRADLFCAAAHFKSRHNDRISGIYVQPAPSGQGALIIAMDGQVAGCLYDPEGSCEKGIPATPNEDFLRACRKLKPLARKQATVELNDAGLHLKDAAGHIIDTQALDTVSQFELPYPDIVTILQRECNATPGMRVRGLSTYLFEPFSGMLKELAEVTGVTSERAPNQTIRESAARCPFAIYQKDAKSAIVLTRDTEHLHFVGILMPISYNKGCEPSATALPDWLTAKTTIAVNA